jgi:hypothetical protein
MGFLALNRVCHHSARAWQHCVSGYRLAYLCRLWNGVATGSGQAPCLWPGYVSMHGVLFGRKLPAQPAATDVGAGGCCPAVPARQGFVKCTCIVWVVVVALPEFSCQRLLRLTGSVLSACGATCCVVHAGACKVSDTILQLCFLPLPTDVTAVVSVLRPKGAPCSPSLWLSAGPEGCDGCCMQQPEGVWSPLAVLLSCCLLLVCFGGLVLLITFTEMHICVWCWFGVGRAHKLSIVNVFLGGPFKGPSKGFSSKSGVGERWLCPG